MAGPVCFADIEQAERRISGTVLETPCAASVALSEATGMRIYCKLENLQRTGSFKERGASNALRQLTRDQKKLGVIAASAGNHALGLSYHAQLLGIPATVVMPKFAPLTKVVNCRKFGAKVILEGASIADARKHADTIVAAEGLTYINGYDHPHIIAGQGTIGLEIARQVPEAEAVVVPVGGAGLIAGVALALKTINPKILIIGVEPERAASFHAAISAGRPVTVEMQPSLADGLSVPQVGENAFTVSRGLVDQIVTLTEHEIARAILRLMELEKCVVEGAGAAPLAACLAGKLPQLEGRKVVLPLCGGNIDLTALDRVISRGLASDGRLFQFTATISDRPGGLARFAALLAEAGVSIIEVTHDRAFAGDDISTVAVHCIVETRDAEHIEFVRATLNGGGFRVR